MLISLVCTLVFQSINTAPICSFNERTRCNDWYVSFSGTFPHPCVCVNVFPESVGLRSKVLRKVEELKSGSVCSGIPDEFLCPITRELMREPVIAAGEQRLDLSALMSPRLSTNSRTAFPLKHKLHIITWHYSLNQLIRQSLQLTFLWMWCVLCTCANRWILVWKRGHRELDQQQESLQSHDEPPFADNPAHPQSHLEDGYCSVEDEPLASWRTP